MLDFGFGWAEWAKMAMAYGCEVAGAELSKERREYAASIGLQLVDLDDLPVRRFHFINTEQVFEHLVNPYAVLQRLAASLTQNGIIKVSVPDSKRSLNAIRRTKQLSSLSAQRIMPIAPLEHINCFEYGSLTTLGARAGLKPMRPEFRYLYNGSAGYFHPRNALKNLLRPVYRHIYPKSTYVYFVRL